MTSVRFSIKPEGEPNGILDRTIYQLDCPHLSLLQIEISEQPAWTRLNRLVSLRKWWLEKQTCDCTVDAALGALDRAMGSCWTRLTHVERMSFYRWPEVETDLNHFTGGR